MKLVFSDHAKKRIKERGIGAKTMKKINYDKEVKILNIRLSNTKSVDSDVKGNVVVDYDKNGGIVNIEIMKISMDEFKKIGNFASNILPQTPVVA